MTSSSSASYSWGLKARTDSPLIPSLPGAAAITVTQKLEPQILSLQPLHHQMSGEIAHRAKTFLDTSGRQYAESPLPAWASSVAILYQLPDSKRLYNRRILPRPWTILLFSSLFVASGWMAYDNAPIDGAGTTAAWSAIYCIMNGGPRKLGNLLRFGRVAPLGITGLVAANTITHGYYYLTVPRSKDEVEELKRLKGE